MTPEEILARTPNILSGEQREAYFTDGYCSATGLIDADCLDRIGAITTEFVAASRNAYLNDARFDFEPDHCAARPRLRRLNQPCDLHEAYWEFASSGPFVDIAADLLGPDVKFHHAKLNFKWAAGGAAVRWHQDIQFWPHTNYDVLTIGVYLDAVGLHSAPMGVLPGSHQGPLYDLYDHEGTWTGSIRDEDLVKLPLDQADYLTGPRGVITVHNCRAVHGSAKNESSCGRPLLLCVYSAADAIPITDLTRANKYSEVVVRGVPARWARFDPRPCLLPPDWTKHGGRRSIFAHQLREKNL